MLGIAAGTIALLLLFASRNGYHRDELYFLAASHHLSFGYVDQPPMAVVAAWLARVALGNTLLGLRLIPALLDGVVVALTGAIARELGGRRFAQAFAALCVGLGGFLVIAHVEGPTIFDAVDWALTSFLIIRILRTGNARLWLAVGAVVAVGLESKETILLLLATLAIGLVVNRQASIFRSSWLWAGVGLAVAGWAPNLAWQAIHHWPAREMDANLRAEHSGLGFALTYPFITLLALQPLVAPVWMAGWWALWTRIEMRPFRAFATSFAIAFVLLWIVIPDRFYYLAPGYPVLFAAGAIVTQEVVNGERGFFRRVPHRRFFWRSRHAAVAIACLGGVLILPLALPVLPPAALAKVPLQAINYNLGEEIGWQTLTDQVAGVWKALPPSERASSVIVTENYGEAGAIDLFGPTRGLPQAYSGHNSFWWWGPPSPATGAAIAVGFDRAALTPYFTSVSLADRIHNAYGVTNDEEGAPIWICTRQLASWSAIWLAFRHYG